MRDRAIGGPGGARKVKTTFPIMDSRIGFQRPVAFGGFQGSALRQAMPKTPGMAHIFSIRRKVNNGLSG
ncbi:hypothetical protein AA13595_2931 [Gluconacetobacter johannae DSM 13595]|nr:hypothetical protein AA13595_2931 [Gluconacetobacter johannae DSM 13595]